MATLAEIEAQGWSLNPGRYTGTAAVDDDDEDFVENLAGLYDEFTRLSDEADELRARSARPSKGSSAHERVQAHWRTLEALIDYRGKTPPKSDSGFL